MACSVNSVPNTAASEAVPAMTSPGPRHRQRSAAAIAVGFLVVVVLSLCTDQVFHWLGVYPPWGQAMPATAHNVLALSYRTVYAVLGSYVAARLAPHSPMRHALVVGIVGVVLGTLGAIATIPLHLGPAWYPIALPAEALPCAWLGGRLHRGATGRPG